MATLSDERLQVFSDHGRTYHRFTLGVKWFGIHLATVIVFLTLTFATGAGVFGGLLAALVVFGLAVFAMRHGMAKSSEPPPGEE